MELTTRQKTTRGTRSGSLHSAPMAEHPAPMAEHPAPVTGPPASRRRKARDGAASRRLVRILVAVVVALLVLVTLLIGMLVSSGDGNRASSTTTTTAERATTGSAPVTTAPPRSDPSTGPSRTIQTPHGTVEVTEVTMQEGIIERQYLLYRPADGPGADPAERRMPAVMALHGLGVDRYDIPATAPWADAVAEDRFVAVFPQGVLNSWNLGPCCPPASLGGVDDVGFLGRVLDQVRARPDVDPDRVYLTGFSNGGMMAIELACQRSDDIAAIAPVAATNVTGCAPSRPTSMLQLHGDPDDTVPYDGSPSLSQVLSSEPFPAVPASAAAWATASGCAPGPTRVDDGDGVRVDRWSGCPKGTAVELITYPGNGHGWPTTPVDGLEEILDFFDVDS